jgi:ABC-type phosphate transport system substrate-binding protein
MNACSGDKQTSETTANGVPTEVNTEVKGSLTIASDDIIFPVIEELTKDFKSIFPNVRVSIIVSDSETSLQSLDSGSVDLICSSLPESKFQSAQRSSFPMASDILTLIVNFNHPELQALVIHGISVNSLKNILNESVTDWNKVHPTITMSHPLKAYMPPKQSGSTEYLAAFTGNESSAIKISDTQFEKDVLKNVGSMQVSLGFCSHTLAYDFSTGFRKSTIYIVGTDWNNSGTLENNELIWDDLEGLKNAYLKKSIPSGLVRIFSVIYLKKSENPVAQHYLDFLKDSGSAVFEKYGFYSINNK